MPKRSRGSQTTPLRILLATNDPHLPQRFGGAYVSTHELAIGLIGRGHSVAVLARLVPNGPVHWINRLKHAVFRKQFPADRALGYPVYRGWGIGDPSIVAHGVEEGIAARRPDVVIAQGGQSMNLAVMATTFRVPAVVYLHDIQFDELAGNPQTAANISYLANSKFTADRFHSLFGLSATVIAPLVIPEAYRVESTREVVLYVNPHPKKGLDIAVALAATRPDIQFVFQESWILTLENRQYLERSIKKSPNIELCPSSRDMRSVYRRARIILVPSQLEEAWGRVATEAQISGIPVLASNRGGLPESVGDGGIMVPFDAPIEHWSEALSTLWDDPVSYELYSKQALERSRRAEIQPDFLLTTLESTLQEIIRASKGLTTITGCANDLRRAPLHHVSVFRGRSER